MTILHRFHFSSALKRMAAIVKARALSLTDCQICKSYVLCSICFNSP